MSEYAAAITAEELADIHEAILARFRALTAEREALLEENRLLRVAEAERDLFRDDAIPSAARLLGSMQARAVTLEDEIRHLRMGVAGTWYNRARPVIDAVREFVRLEEQRIPHPTDEEQLKTEEAAQDAYDSMKDLIAGFDADGTS